MVDGQVVDMTPEEEIERAAEEAAEAVRLAEVAAEEAAHGYRKQRAEAYRARLGKRPGNTFAETIGDVLDALLRDADLRQQTGGTLDADLVAILGEWRQVKIDFPKPAPPAAE